MSGGISLIPPFAIKPLMPDGSWQKDWYLFFNSMWTQQGGFTPTTPADLMQDPQAPQPASDVVLAAIGDALQQAPIPAAERSQDDQAPPPAIAIADTADSGRMESLEAEVATLRQQIQALQQGQT